MDETGDIVPPSVKKLFFQLTEQLLMAHCLVIVFSSIWVERLFGLVNCRLLDLQTVVALC